MKGKTEFRFTHEFHRAYEIKKRSRWLVDMEAQGKVIYNLTGDYMDIVQLEHRTAVSRGSRYPVLAGVAAVVSLFDHIEEMAVNGVLSMHSSLLFVDTGYDVGREEYLLVAGFAGKFC